jgi:hypothetical protein
MDAPIDNTATRGAVEWMLVEFHHAPGKYPLIQRQPALLFSSLKDILQIAGGRPSERDDAPSPTEAVQQAACFFIRSALLYPGADHYALLGLDRSADSAAVKDRYRLLMRLIHPDFSRASTLSWPVDAAVRVNKAYEVLSSAVLRRSYDHELDGAVQPQPKSDVRPRASRVAAQTAMAEQEPRQRLKRLATMFGGVGGVALLAVSYFGSSTDKGSLVQRTAPLPAQELAIAAREDPPPPAPPAVPPSPAENITAAMLEASRSPASATAPHIADVAAAKPPAASAVAASPAPARVERAVAVRAPEPLRPVTVAVGSPRPAPAATRAIEPAPHDAPALTPPMPVLAAPVAPPRLLLATLPENPARLDAPVVQPPPSSAEVVVAPAARRTAMPSVERNQIPPANVVVAGAPSVPASPALQIAAQALPAVPTIVPIVAVASPARPPVPGLTLAEAQPLLSQLLQQLESGMGDRVLSVLERNARGAPGAQALLRHYNSLVDGARPIKLSHVQFKAAPLREGRLVVTGQVRLQTGDQTVGALGKELSVMAEFTSRDGTVVMTKLARAQEN